jgi:hypothetical protein
MNMANLVLAQLFKSALFTHELEQWDAQRMRSFLDKQVALLRERGVLRDGMSDADIEVVIEEVVKWDSLRWKQA